MFVSPDRIDEALSDVKANHPEAFPSSRIHAPTPTAKAADEIGGSERAKCRKGLVNPIENLLLQIERSSRERPQLPFTP